MMQIATGQSRSPPCRRRSRAAAASAQVEGRTPEDVARDEDYWTEIRNAFTVERNIINFNNGDVSPAPLPVQDAMRRYLEYSDMGPMTTMVNVLYPRRSSGVRETSRPGRGLRSGGNGHYKERQRVQRDRAIWH